MIIVTIQDVCQGMKSVVTAKCGRFHLYTSKKDRQWGTSLASGREITRHEDHREQGGEVGNEREMGRRDSRRQTSVLLETNNKIDICQGREEGKIPIKYSRRRWQILPTHKTQTMQDYNGSVSKSASWATEPWIQIPGTCGKSQAWLRGPVAPEWSKDRQSPRACWPTSSAEIPSFCLMADAVQGHEELSHRVRRWKFSSVLCIGPSPYTYAHTTHIYEHIQNIETSKVFRWNKLTSTSYNL